MASFDLAGDPSGDLFLLRDGPVVLFWDRGVLETSLDELSDLGYHQVRLDAGGWLTGVDMSDALAAALEFPSYYGGRGTVNLNALADCLSDVATGAYGFPDDAAGLALVLHRFDAFAGREPAVAHALVEIFTEQSRFAMLFGRRMVALVQVSNGDFLFPLVGARRLSWNMAEHLNARRH